LTKIPPTIRHLPPHTVFSLPWDIGLFDSLFRSLVFLGTVVGFSPPPTFFHGHFSISVWDLSLFLPPTRSFFVVGLVASLPPLSFCDVLPKTTLFDVISFTAPRSGPPGRVYLVSFFKIYCSSLVLSNLRIPVISISALLEIYMVVAPPFFLFSPVFFCVFAFPLGRLTFFLSRTPLHFDSAGFARPWRVLHPLLAFCVIHTFSFVTTVRSSPAPLKFPKFCFQDLDATFPTLLTRPFSPFLILCAEPTHPLCLFFPQPALDDRPDILTVCPNPRGSILTLFVGNPFLPVSLYPF